MNTVSINILLPTDLYNNLLVFVSKIAKVNSNDFIIEAINQKLISEKEQLKGLLIEGYIATKQEDLELAHEFETSDLEKYDN